jgi:hypothetical protein
MMIAMGGRRKWTTWTILLNILLLLTMLSVAVQTGQESR